MPDLSRLIDARFVTFLCGMTAGTRLPERAPRPRVQEVDSASTVTYTAAESRTISGFMLGISLDEGPARHVDALCALRPDL